MVVGLRHCGSPGIFLALVVDCHGEQAEEWWEMEQEQDPEGSWMLHREVSTFSWGSGRRLEGFKASGEESARQCRSLKRLGFDPWVRKIPWRRAWQPTPVFLPGESPWTEEPGGLQSMGLQRVGPDGATEHKDVASFGTGISCWLPGWDSKRKMERTKVAGGHHTPCWAHTIFARNFFGC